jgi:hypothetical protein
VVNIFWSHYNCWSSVCFLRLRISLFSCILFTCWIAVVLPASYPQYWFGCQVLKSFASGRATSVVADRSEFSLWHLTYTICCFPYRQMKVPFRHVSLSSLWTSAPCCGVCLVPNPLFYVWSILFFTNKMHITHIYCVTIHLCQGKLVATVNA